MEINSAYEVIHQRYVVEVNIRDEHTVTSNPILHSK